jgi:broad specificity phosphatase PhoE
MSRLRRLILVRHGESTGNSKERLVGSGDPDLSREGAAQMAALGRSLGGQLIDLIVASPKRRAWQAAQILAGGYPIRLENGLREINFGRWEGQSLSEVEVSDPVRFKQWREAAPEFEYPGGERRQEFRARVARGLARLEESGATSALVVSHKGVIRTLIEQLAGEQIDRDRPALAEALILTRLSSGWILGQHSSDPS